MGLMAASLTLRVVTFPVPTGMRVSSLLAGAVLLAAALAAMGENYDESIAQSLAEFSGAAYACDSPKCQRWTCTACRLHPNAEILRFHNDTDNTSGYVGYDPDLDVIVVAFSGTHIDGVQSWASNVNPSLVDYPCPNCQVHEGFINAYTAMAPQIIESLAYALSKAPSADLWVTGHSLGGALATLCTLDLVVNHTLSVQALYTFGQPRVGNGPFAAWFVDAIGDTPFFRVVHDRDPIPHFPPVMLGFAHSPLEVFYNAPESAYRICDETGEDPTCCNRYIWPWDLKVSDHLEYFGVAM